MAAWLPESLLRMDEQFVIAVEVAFRRGLEDPDTAARTSHAVTLAPQERTSFGPASIPASLRAVGAVSRAPCGRAETDRIASRRFTARAKTPWCIYCCVTGAGMTCA